VLNVLLNLMIYHGAGNVSTYTALVAHSGGNDMYQAAAAMCNGLSGFNHGGAAYQGLRFVLNDLNIENCSDREALRAIAKELIQRGLPIWCVGHRILRGSNDDPRAAVAKKLIEEIASRHKHGEVLLRRASIWYEVAVEEIVTAKPGIGFQAVNIDGYTGLLAYLAGLIPEKDAASIAGLFFAVSRTAGALAECFWSGVSGKVALIRPSVVTMELLTRLAQEA
ncbi:citrate/2-methylcitrate synthase, partial [bacterium]|nr:citrate/2-methylcitrate synthase [bacterium]